MSNNFQLDISTGQGLSYAIDEALDKEFSQNVNLTKIKQWQSIFNIIKSDQAEQTQADQKQFTSDDTDVRNKKHFQVNAGKYNLTQNAWNQIVTYVKNELKLTTPADTKDVTPEEGSKSAEEQQATQVKSNETKLTEMLQEENIQLSDEEFLDVLSKYENKLALKANGLDITDDSIKSDILAYINGKKYEKTEDLFYNQSKEFVLPGDENAPKETFELEGVKQAMEYGEQHPDNLEEAYRLNSEGFIQFGNSQLQLYDNSGENLVDFNEFLDHEQKRIDENFDDEEKAAAKKVFDYIDINKDGNIDLQEMTLHGFAMSKITDGETTRTGDTISYDDWWTTQTTLAGVGTDDQSPSYVKAKDRYEQLRELGQETIYNYKEHLKKEEEK